MFLGVASRSIIEVKYVDYRPFTTRPTPIPTQAPTVHTSTTSAALLTKTHQPRQFSFPTIDPSEENEANGITANMTVKENKPAMKHPYKGRNLVHQALIVNEHTNC